jgi:hypothetical protein
MGAPVACGQAFLFVPGADGGPDAPTGLDGAVTPDQTAEGGTSDGPSPGVDGSDGSDGPIDSPPEAPPAGHVVYVSTSGSDLNDGTDPTKPKKTIAAALKRVATIATPAEVHVCTGTYTETALSLALPIGLRGAYDCTTWTQTATYGYPTFDRTNLTIIQNGAPNVQPATLLVSDGATSSAVVDGFEILGAATANNPTVGLATYGATAVSITNDTITGGGGVGTGTAPGSVGLDVDSGSPAISDCVVSGGSGTGSTGSIGMAINGTAPSVHDCRVSGGTGTAVASSNSAGQASVGVFIATSLVGPNSLSSMSIEGSDSSAVVVGSTIGVAIGVPGGVSAGGLTVDIENSAIGGGAGSGTSTLSIGIAINAPGSAVRVLSDRIYGGSRSATASQTIGIFAYASGNLTVYNSEIHGGDVPVSATATAYGVQLLSATSPTFIDDTIYAGPALGYGIYVGANVAGVSMTDDLFTGGGVADTLPAISVAACTGQLTTLDHSAFVSLPILYGCGSPATTATSISQLSMELTAMLTPEDIEIGSATGCAAGACVPDPSCPGPQQTCMPTIFGASWTSDDGVRGLEDGAPVVAGDAGAMFQGWTLAPNVSCALARGGTPAGNLTTDIFGQTRSTTTPTIGAFELTQPTCTQ